MNIFLPQSEQAMIELEEIADVKRQIITPRSSTPIIGIKQDGLLGAYNLTSPNMNIDWRDTMNIVSYTTIDDFEAFKKGKDYVGSDIYSLIIPSNINTKNAGLEVDNGLIKKGQIIDAHLGSQKANSLIHLIWDEYGMDETKKFLDNTQRLANNFNLLNGFTVGIKDLYVPDTVHEQRHKMFQTKMLEVDHQVTEMENNPDFIDEELFEESVTATLNAVRGDVSKLVIENLAEDNKFKIMMKSGSKGKEENIGQMIGCIGQQNVEGKRIRKRINGRSLPYFFQNDDSAKARGFIPESFQEGAHPIHFIFHNMASREGLIDTAIKSVTGDTPIIISENGVSRRVMIGDWIDILLDQNKEEVKHYKERDMELLELKEKVLIPTTDENGKVSWGEIKNITRHDPGKELYKIITLGGRDVIVTESKSLLVWNHEEKKFLRTSTPDVKVGDFVPTTMNLPEPEKINRFIEVSRYLPKNEYYYGTDFHIAKQELEKVLSEKKKCPQGWWKSQNGKTFCLPYKYSHRLRRVIVRSNIESIEDGQVYPYSANRDETSIPERFEMNRETGCFIGLFLSEGNADIPSGYVAISNNNKKIQKFVVDWFAKFNIVSSETSKINNIGGLSEGVRGYSTMLARFLTRLVGHGARHKYVFDEAFTAPREFIIGLLDGYFSGDSTITKNSIQVGCASKRLLIGINMLLTRLGIFAKLSKTQMKKNNLGTKDIADINVLSVRGQWAKKFAEMVTLIDEEKKNLLMKMKPSQEHRNYPEHNDVILDKIVSIEKIDVALYPKVYDLTVPSTLNFGLANGLHVVDTAESGYVQRKLIKSLEDAMVTYDLTVRNANQKILQFVYGDDGVDTTKQSKHDLKILKMGNAEIAEKYKFTNAELGKLKYNAKQNDDYYQFLLAMRDDLRQSKVRASMNYIVMESSYMLPVNLMRIINNVKGMKVEGGKEELEPTYILKRLDEILDYKNTKIMCMTKEDSDDPESIKYKDEMRAKTVFRFALHETLAPKICIVEHNLSKAKFDMICERIIKAFNKAIVEPGEMIGTIAAQSIGEPVTQMTLNSVDWLDRVVFQDANGSIIVTEIGKFIDEKINLGKGVTKLGDNLPDEKGDTYYVDTKDENLLTVSVDKDGKLSWNRVTALTKHLPINKDGTDDLIKIKTRLGRSVTATKAKSFLTRINNEIVAIRGDELSLYTKLPIVMKYPQIPTELTHLDMIRYFPKTEYIYGSEIEKAKEFRENIRSGGSRAWFKPYHGEKFTTPYSRQDSLGVVLDGKISQKYVLNCVYPKKGKDMIAEIPEKIPLDEEFGFFLGAYLAEGLSTETYVCISNNDKKYRDRVLKFVDKCNIGYHIDIQEDKIQEGWTSTDIRIHSVILAKLMKHIAGTGAEHKFVDGWVYQSPECFRRELLNGYFSGDGTISSEKHYISNTSVSEDLIDGLVLLLSQFGIVAKKAKPTKISENNRGSKDIKQHYTLSIRNDNIKRFSEKIGFAVDEKRVRLIELSEREFRYENGVYDKIPGNNLDCLVGDIHRNMIDTLLANKITKKDREILEKASKADVYYDDIISIESVKPSHGYVYDLTVENDKTFTTFSGICMMDTFHHAGIGAKGTASLGVPRVKELLHFSKNIKTPRTYIYMEPEIRNNMSLANKIASHVKHTTLSEIRDKVEIYFDPDPMSKGSFMEQDNVYNIFYSHNPSKYSCQPDVNTLPWLMRIILNKERMLNKDITLLDIKAKFCNHWEKRYKDARGVKKEEKQLLDKITQTAILSNYDNDKLPIIHIRFDMTDFDFSTIIGFLDVFIDNFKLKGVDNIDKILDTSETRVVSFNNEDQALINDKEYVTVTSGVNLIDLRYVNGIDVSRTICNDVVEIYERFGIEAARAALLKEIVAVFSGSGNFVNYSHLAILIDTMTSSGTLTSIDRHGMGKLDTDPLARASFEKTVDQLIQAAVFGEQDHMKSVSSRIMAGMVVKGGTGLCNIILDTKMLENSEYIEDIETKYKKTFSELTSNPVISDVLDKEEPDIFLPDM